MVGAAGCEVLPCSEGVACTKAGQQALIAGRHCEAWLQGG